MGGVILPEDMGQIVKDLESRVRALERANQNPFRTNMFRVIQVGSGTITIPNPDAQDWAQKTIPHNLGWKPAFLVYDLTPEEGYDNKLWCVRYHFDSGGSWYERALDAFTDDDNLYIHWLDESLVGAFPANKNYKYFLFKETAAS